MFNFKTHFILNEGGVAGHMSHVYENINLTAAQLKTLFKDLIQGKKENISEKVDGQNIFFTWDNISHTVRFARRTSDIKSNGMDFEMLKTRFANHPPTVRAAFIDGGDVIQHALHEIPENIKTQIFGNSGNHWINAEIMHTKNPNLIQYSGNYIVMHSLSKFNGSHLEPQDENFKILTKYLDKQTTNQSEKAWAVVGPRLIKIENFNALDGPYGDFCKTIDSIFKSVGLNENNTISDYIESVIAEELLLTHMPAPAIEEITAAIVGRKKVNITQLKKLYGTAYAKAITEYAAQTNIAKVRDRATKPIQEAVTDIGVQVLKTLTSYFVKSHDKEINRVRDELRSAIAAIEQTKDNFSQERMNLLKSQMSKLKKVENFCSTIEGIVFEDPPGSGNLYKLTGAFAPVNQILGLISYGRGNIPPIASK